MSTADERMHWRPGAPSPPLELRDVLVMLGVERRPEGEQRRAVDDALRDGALGASSVAALHSADWIETKRRDDSPSPSVGWRLRWSAVLVAGLIVCITAIWMDNASAPLRASATAVLVFILARAGPLMFPFALTRETERAARRR